MVIQRGLGQSNQMELKQKGDEHKEEKTATATAEQQAQHSKGRAECFLVSVGDWADGELARRLLRRPSGGVDGQVVRRPRRTELPRRSEPAASASSLVSVVLGPGRSSSVPGLSLGFVVVRQRLFL